MSGHHDHSHAVGTDGTRTRLLLVFGITVLVMVAEITGTVLGRRLCWPTPDTCSRTRPAC